MIHERLQALALESLAQGELQNAKFIFRELGLLALTQNQLLEIAIARALKTGKGVGGGVEIHVNVDPSDENDYGRLQ